MKRILILFGLVFWGYALFSQEVISSAGATQQAAGYVLSWTIGEPVIQTLSSGPNILTQGFHQSKLIITAIGEIPEQNILITVFPNPTHEFAIVKFNNQPKQNTYKLFDSTGRVLEWRIINSTETQVDLIRFAKGTYFLKVFQDDNQPIQTFKIIKQ